jgi:hypothetical protein
MPCPIALVATSTPLDISEWTRIGNEGAELVRNDRLYPITVGSEFSRSADAEMDQFEKWSKDVTTCNNWRFGKHSPSGDVEEVRQMLSAM